MSFGLDGSYDSCSLIYEEQEYDFYKFSLRLIWVGFVKPCLDMINASKLI
jgi:hypothetical protein